MNVKEFDYTIIKRLQTASKKTKQGSKTKNIDYVDEVITFDIETTNDKEEKQAFMYIWAVQFGRNCTLYGRTWEEFQYFLEHCREQLNDRVLVIYVHNLSFEFSFLKGIYNFTDEEVFATESRKILRCSMFDCIEFRCSLFLTNLSLDKFCKEMGVENKKLSGAEFDYSKNRYPWTPLTEYEINYMTNDVKGLMQALKKKIAITSDNIATVPLTATGYARRDIKEAMKSYSGAHMHQMFPEVEIYLLLREAFRGGNTHGNRFRIGQLIDNVSSYDMTSSYPNVLLTEKYPMTKFMPVYWDHEKELIKYLKTTKKAYIGRFYFEDLKLKENVYCPYISESKCRGLRKEIPMNEEELKQEDEKKKKNPKYTKHTLKNNPAVKCFNGRVLRADSFETTLTDIDFRLIDQMYTWKRMGVVDLYDAEYGWLPPQYRDTVLKYFVDKTELKGVKEDSEEYPFYAAAKAILNCLYGMNVQDVGKGIVEYTDNAFKIENVNKMSDEERTRVLNERLKDASRKPFTLYQWGVWCAAWGRARLQKGIDLVGRDFVYCDTDSVKFVNDHDKDFEKLNTIIRDDAKEKDAYATTFEGKVSYIGEWTKENYPLPNRFKTLGAKKYVLEYPDKSLHLTIAGVSKAKKKDENGKLITSGDELGKIENFEEGFVFKKFGGVVGYFNDGIDKTIEREGHKLHISDNLYLEEGTYTLNETAYTLGETDEMIEILANLDQIKFLDFNLEGGYQHLANKGS